jgi:predicted Holliday junction resolvase-like endonuclease
MFKYTCEWAIVPFSQILIIKSPIIANTCLDIDNLSQLKMKVEVKKKTLRCTWKKCIQIMSQSIRSEFKNKLKVHKFVEDNKRLLSIIKESYINVHVTT